MQEAESISNLSFAHWDLGIGGRSLDDRGRAAFDFLSSNTDQIISIQYNEDEFTLKIDNKNLNVEDIEESLHLFKDKSIILEATTLGFVEMFLCCRAFRTLGSSQLSFLYVEPLGYNRSPRRSQPLHKRDFELSDEVPGYRAIPGAAVILSDRAPQRSVFFLGFEERRLDRALEDHQMIQPSLCSVVFGVPAYKPGWEMDSFSNNIRVIRERNIRGGVHFCGAANPAATVEILTQIYGELANKERLFIAPIGTKPHGIGVALFTSDKSRIGILYDHPKRREERTSKVSRWHLYNVEFR